MSNGTITFRTGRQAKLTDLHQYPTYRGHLEGLPTVESNRDHVERLLRRCEDESPGFGRPYLIPPVETPISLGIGARLRRRGVPSRLPEVTCIAQFLSFSPVRDPSMTLSGMVVVWFQSEFAFPIDPTVLEQIVAIDWDSHAADGDP